MKKLIAMSLFAAGALLAQSSGSSATKPATQSQTKTHKVRRHKKGSTTSTKTATPAK